MFASGLSRKNVVRWLCVCSAVLVSCVLRVGDAHAYAWMMQQGYAQCATCHTDPSGGEGLTGMGRVQSQQLLSQPWSNTVSSSALAAYSLNEPDWLRLGASARYLALLSLPQDNADARLRHFPMQLDVYSTWYYRRLRAGVSLGYASVPENSPHLRAAQVFQKPSGANLISRWHWLGYAPSDRWLLRLGRLNLPFGLRTSEHVLWTREATATDRESDQQHGLALAGWGRHFRTEGMLIAGNLQTQPAAVREQGYSAYFEWLIDQDWAVGVNSLLLGSKQNILTGRAQATLRQAHGLTLRTASLAPVTLLAEADVLSTSGRGLGHTGWLSADLNALQGLHFLVTGEWLDAGKSDTGSVLAGAGKPRTGLWLSAQWFLATHWDVRLDFVLRHPQARTLQAQAHFYL